MVKTCRVCGLEEEHGIRSSGKPQSHCKKCQSIYSRNNYRTISKEKHKESRAAARLRSKERGTALINAAKSVPCTDCGVQYASHIMQFDHILNNKNFTISNRKNLSLTRIQEEIDKCEVVCANCHADRTWKRINLPH
jgi:hypothetical protein